MPRADSTIRVAIIGDVKGLSKALGSAEKDVSGFGGKLKGIAAGVGFGLLAKEALDFGATAIGEADRIGDAMTRLEHQVGVELAGAIDDTADDFAKLGQSRQDILELAASFADAATALGLGAPFIATWADDAAATAAAMDLLGKGDAATILDNINKAAGGATKPLRELGVFIDEAAVAQLAMETTGKNIPGQLTDSELAAARYSIILEQLKPQLDAVAAGSGDVERKQAEMEARFETLTGKIGQGLEGPLNDLLGWILAGIDGWDKFIAKVGDVDDILTDLGGTNGPVAVLARAIAELLSQFGGVFGLARQAGVFNAPSGGGSRPANHAPHPGIVLNVVPRDSADTERAVVNALRDYNARSGRQQ